jgi:putative ABC transport system substrate-binding protein
MSILRVFLACLCVVASAAAGAPARIVVVTSDDLAVYTEPVAPFLQAMEQAGVRARVIHLHGRAAEAEQAASLLRREDPKVVFAIGAKAAYTVKQRLPSTPLIHASVSDPGRYGIEGSLVTGVRLEAAPSMYLSQFLGLFPDVEKVGVLHAASASSQRLAAIEASGGQVGLDVRARAADSPRAMRRLLPDILGEVDALWLMPDRDVLTPEVFRTVVDEARRRQVPLLVDNDTMVRAGGVFSVVADPDAVGGQAAAMALSILDGKAPELIEVADPAGTMVVLNLDALGRSGLSIDPLLLDFVDIQIE